MHIMQTKYLVIYPKLDEFAKLAPNDLSRNCGIKMRPKIKFFFS